MMKVLSLFDGMSCGQIALRELGIVPEVYYASEIDRHAIAQTMLNFPDTVQLGDVERWREWDIDWEDIDLVMGGSPCQGFSLAGKGLAFDDPRSRLFFVFADILDYARSRNPGVRFLLENVNMKREYLRVISDRVGVRPVCIDSALVSAQRRRRWYWTDIRTRREGLFGEVYSDIQQPEDHGILLQDVLDQDVHEKYFLSEKASECVLNEMRSLKKYTAIGGDKALTGKAPVLSANSERNNVVVQLNPAQEFGREPRQQNRVYDTGFKSPALSQGHGGQTHSILSEGRIRRLTPTECARLQTVPPWYQWECSATQQYRMLGNGWTVEVIKHILSYEKWN